MENEKIISFGELDKTLNKFQSICVNHGRILERGNATSEQIGKSRTQMRSTRKHLRKILRLPSEKYFELIRKRKGYNKEGTIIISG